MKYIVMAFRVTIKREKTDKKASVFRSTHNCRSSVYNFEKLHSILKEGRVQITFHWCFKEVYMRMVHISKPISAESTWVSLVCQKLLSETDVHDIENTLVTEWRSFMAVSDIYSEDVDENGLPSPRRILVSLQKFGNVTRLYITACLYSWHNSWGFYVTEVQILNSTL